MSEKKRIVILGGGESGVGAAVLAKVKGFDTFLSDTGNIAPKYREMLDKWEIAYEHGHPHTQELVLNADEVIKSPGVPPTAPLVKAVVAKGIPVISEIEFAGRYTDAKMVCITASNGKTTTTLLLYHILKTNETTYSAALPYTEESRSQRRSGRQCGQKPGLSGGHGQP